MKDYTNISDNYPIEEKNFIRGYVPVKGNYRVTLAKGNKITIPMTKEQKNILERKLIEQVNMVSEADIQNIEQKIKTKNNKFRISLVFLIISIIIASFPALFGIIGIISTFTLSAITVNTIHSLNKEKAIYNDIIKNKLIIKEADLLNSLLQIKNLTVRKDISTLFKKRGRKTITTFIKHDTKATINNLQFITLEELNYLREAAVKYKEFKESFDKYDEFSSEGKQKVKK